MSVELTDEELVMRVRDGEVHLFDLLMRRHNQRVYRTVRSVLGSDNDAEDAMQQTYLLAYLHLGQFQGTAKFSTWLTRIAVNESVSRLRKTTEYLSEDAIMDRAHESENPEESASRHELGRFLERAVEMLPEIYRTAVMLRDVECLSGAEAAEALGVSEDVVKQRLVRARAMIEQRLASQTREQMSAAFLFHAARCDRVVASVMAKLGRASSRGER